MTGDAALVCVTYAPIHPGDFLDVMASPAFGAPAPIPEVGRMLGAEGIGGVEALCDAVDPMLGLKACHSRRFLSRIRLSPMRKAWLECALPYPRRPFRNDGRHGHPSTRTI